MLVIPSYLKMNHTIEVTNFPFALCPETAEINTAFLQEPICDFPPSAVSTAQRAARAGLASRQAERAAAGARPASFLEVPRRPRAVST